MLQILRISNFALIDEVQINFNEAYTVITGETGSGKSILLNALNLILGERADFSVIGQKILKLLSKLSLRFLKSLNCFLRSMI